MRVYKLKTFKDIEVAEGWINDLSAHGYSVDSCTPWNTGSKYYDSKGYSIGAAYTILMSMDDGTDSTKDTHEAFPEVQMITIPPRLS